MLQPWMFNLVSVSSSLRGETDGAIPKVATADGRDKIPREMFLAIMTNERPVSTWILAVKG
jgi:hypothetical protein